jgi:hypothetical protein
MSGTSGSVTTAATFTKPEGPVKTAATFTKSAFKGLVGLSATAPEQSAKADFATVAATKVAGPLGGSRALVALPFLALLGLAGPAYAQSTQPASQPASQPAPPADQAAELAELKAELARLEARLKTLGEEADPERVEDLERIVEALSARVAALDEAVAAGGGAPRPPADADDSRLTGSTFGGDWTWRVGKTSTSLGGYASWKYSRLLDQDPATLSFFDLPRFVLFLHSTLSERISFSTELEIEHVGVNTNDDFRFRGEVVLEFAAMDFELTDWLSLRTGVILVPMGKLNLVHDEPIQDLTERPLVDTFLLPSTWFEPGFGVYGERQLTEDALLRYEAYAIQGLTDRITSDGGLRGARGTQSFDTNENKGLVGRVSLEPYLGLELGLSGYAGYYDPASIRGIHILAVDGTWRRGPWEVVGEAAAVRLEHGFNNLGQLVPTGMRGLWLEGHYHLYLDQLRAYRGLRKPHLTLIGRFDYTDTDTKLSTDDRLRLTGGVNFRPIEDFVIKLEYHRDLEGLAERVRDDLFVISTALSF